MKALAILLLILIACSQPIEPTPQPTLKPPAGALPSGTATTQDGQTIAYQMYANKAGSPAIILIHQLRRSRADWDSVAKWLQKSGYTVIVPDLRGHGQSTGNLETFTPEDYNKITNDIAAMKSVLENQGANVKRTGIIGASIGANIAYNYAITEPDVKTVVLLSPGLEYRGIVIDTSTLGRPFLVVASQDDNYSAATAQEFKMNTNANVKMYEDAGHATNMFSKKDLAPTILSWLQENV